MAGRRESTYTSPYALGRSDRPSTSNQILFSSFSQLHNYNAFLDIQFRWTISTISTIFESLSFVAEFSRLIFGCPVIWWMVRRPLKHSCLTSFFFVIADKGRRFWRFVQHGNGKHQSNRHQRQESRIRRLALRVYCERRRS